MSSAILYLAIVAIWAVVLVPRWLRPRPEQPVTEQPAEPQPATPEVVPEPAAAGQREDAYPAEATTWAQADAPGGPGASAQYDTPPEPDASPEPDAESAPAIPYPAARRTDILQARRRILAMLVALTIGAVGLAVTRIAASWVIIPPTLLLTGFLVLLREVAHTDARRAGGAILVSQAATPPVAGQEPEPFRDNGQASPDLVPATDAAPDAEVIDISARVSDQVYDQYADAADRAVGD